MFDDSPPRKQDDDDGLTTLLVVGGACVAAYYAAKVFIPEHAHYEDDTYHVFGIPIAGKRSVLVDWLN